MKNETLLLIAGIVAALAVIFSMQKPSSGAVVNRPITPEIPPEATTVPQLIMPDGTVVNAPTPAASAAVTASAPTATPSISLAQAYALADQIAARTAAGGPPATATEIAQVNAAQSTQTVPPGYVLLPSRNGQVNTPLYIGTPTRPTTTLLGGIVV